MTVSAALASRVTVHQVRFLPVCKITSAGMTTVLTQCISMRIGAIYVWEVQANIRCIADCPHDDVWERNKMSKNRGRLIKTSYIKLFEAPLSARQVLGYDSARLLFLPHNLFNPQGTKRGTGQISVIWMRVSWIWWYQPVRDFIRLQIQWPDRQWGYDHLNR